MRRSCFHWDSFSGNVLIPHIGSFVMVKKIFGTKNLIKFFSCMYVGMCVYLNIRICILKTVWKIQISCINVLLQKISFAIRTDYPCCG